MKEYQDKYKEEETVESVKDSYNRIFARRIIELQEVAKQELQKSEAANVELETKE